MGLKEKVKKSFKEYKTKRKRTKAALKSIKEKVKIAGLKEKEKQMIRLAKEKERIDANRRLSAYKKPKSMGFGFYGTSQGYKLPEIKQTKNAFGFK